jgi:hypothetical protein
MRVAAVLGMSGLLISPARQRRSIQTTFSSI